MNISLTQHAVGQGLALVLQYANYASTIVPPKAQPYVALVIGIAQAGLAFLAHYSPVPGGSNAASK